MISGTLPLAPGMDLIAQDGAPVLVRLDGRDQEPTDEDGAALRVRRGLLHKRARLRPVIAMTGAGANGPSAVLKATGPEPDRERILETRLILSQDFGAWNVAANWINESDLDGGETAFGYACGVMKRLHAEAAEHPGHAPGGLGIRPAAIAFEIFGALGDEHSFDLRPARQEHYFQPSVTFHAGEHTMVGVAFGIGLTEASDDLARLTWGWKF